jgi:fructose-specific phosphotransferase system IIC component
MNNLLKQPQTTVTVSKAWPDRLAGAGKVIVTQYAAVLDRQETIGVKRNQLAIGAVGCLLAGALFGASYGKDTGFLFALLAGLGLGAAVTFLWVCYQASKRTENPQAPAFFQK